MQAAVFHCHGPSYSGSINSGIVMKATDRLTPSCRPALLPLAERTQPRSIRRVLLETVKPIVFFPTVW